MLREISETEKDKYHMTSLICEIKKKKKIHTHKKLSAKTFGRVKGWFGQRGV